jgi:hypothetical protein
MSEQPRKRPASPFIVWPVCVFLVVVLYVGSFGPVARFTSDETCEFLCDTVYFPITWIEENTDITRTRVGQACVRYVEWWLDVGSGPYP